jgi:hypothetical protein
MLRKMADNDFHCCKRAVDLGTDPSVGIFKEFGARRVFFFTLDSGDRRIRIPVLYNCHHCRWQFCIRNLSYATWYS